MILNWTHVFLLVCGWLGDDEQTNTIKAHLKVIGQRLQILLCTPHSKVNTIGRP